MSGHENEQLETGAAPSTALVIRTPAPTPLAMPAERSRTDTVIVRLWLAGKAEHTQRVYEADSERLFAYSGKTLAQTDLEDLQGFAADLEAQKLSAATRKRILASIKSLFSFASDGGIRHIQYNVAAALRLPKPKNRRNERNLSKEQVAQLIGAAAKASGAMSPRPMRQRNRMIAELLYLAGLRAEELTRLCWIDAKAAGDGGVLTIYGKGDKTRFVRLESEAWQMLSSWRGSAADDSPIFVSRKGGALSTGQVWRIVSDAAAAAGFEASPHFLRHAHATHAIDDGCDVRVLQQTLGHASIETTQQYIHSRPKQSSAAFIKRITPVATEGEAT